MISLSLKELAEIFAQDSAGLPRTGFRGITIDSRKSCEGMLFVAIRGANFDGHNFVEAAFRSGAVAALVEQPQPCEIEQIRVDDCKIAMGRLANYWRRRCDPQVIALTGSNGKTTVKEMLHRILARQTRTLATRGNLNNDIGVPLTLFELDPRHDFAIIEMGANHRGEIARLAEIAEPDIVYVNNVAAAHLSGFGDVQGVIEAKGELYAYCGPAQLALFNVDEAASEYWKKRCVATTQMSCGIDHAADVGASWLLEDGSLVVEFRYRDETRSCKLALMGEHNARNALAAVSLALLAGVAFGEAVENLAGFSGVKGRLQVLDGPAHSRLIDDSYNANPDSLTAGIKALCALPGSPWLALGDMAELGAEAEALHRQAARAARELGVEKFFGVGEMSCIASREFGAAGYCFERIDDMAQAILAQIHDGVNLLVKGSRAAGMERLVEMLTQSANRGDVNAV
ncbi:MAG: UDP-N-acetylmuramoyl-tripeptide--D-alanyl-D-alanine ligase [Gammaproteobacteria bacterium]|nr:UDP-N-acetylmuramoyl-tripeptide--D-alanyl-D-alanine ligase [Gammaproteobacteria bacterium]MDH3537057.1 UDP-N-acetylmuramoyl-tripeptide--D-alanyl-D-alanine ligase [Gammaproteobacteria bacterium]